jgi:hypothetical protein
MMITLHNFKVEYSGSREDVQLSDDVVGKYNGITLVFERDSNYYEVSYKNKNISSEQHKKDIIKIANHML